MLRNYLSATLRNLARNKLYAAINVIGLGIGFAAAMVIALYVRDEFTYDTWIPGHARTYMVTETMHRTNRTPLDSHTVPADLAAQMKLDFPEVEAVARLMRSSISLQHGDIEANERITWADPSIFDVLPMPAIAGDLKAALDRPDALVLTRRMAEKYFGDRDPIGQTMQIDRTHPMHVAAVIENLPSNTHLNAEIFGSGLATFSILWRRTNTPNPTILWQDNSYTYVRLAPGASVDDVNRAMPAFLQRHKKAALDQIGEIVLRLTPLASIHLHPDNDSSAMKPPGDARISYALAAVGLLIVAVASINFVNLMTARATRRAVEVGVRKVSGAERRNLIAQFLGESLLYAVFSLILAAVTVVQILPPFNAFLDRGIAFDAGDLGLGAGIAGIAVLVGVLAGLYPAFVLSAFRPAVALKSHVRRADSGVVRKALVIVQFAILIGLIVSVAVIYRQSVFALNDGLKVDKEQVVLVATSCKTAFPERVRALPGVRGAACSDSNPASFAGSNILFRRDGREAVLLSMHGIDFGYLEMYGQRPLAGRFAAQAYTTDSGIFEINSDVGPNLVINETAVRGFGFAAAPEAVGQTVYVQVPGSTHETRFEIIGVVPDFSFDTVHTLIPPSMYFVAPQYFQWLNIKLSGDALPATLEAIDALWKETGDPRPITRQFLDQELERAYLDIRRQSQMFGLFSAVAIFIAALGLFGLSAFIAEQRTREIGIRKSMGAGSTDMLRLLLWQFTKPVLWANLIAWPAAYVIMRRWLESFAYHVELVPWMFLAATAAALGIALLTVIGHALVVARSHPVNALRYE